MPLHENSPFLSWKLMQELGNVSRTFPQHHPQMQVKALPSTKEAIRGNDLSSQAF